MRIAFIVLLAIFVFLSTTSAQTQQPTSDITNSASKEVPQPSSTAKLPIPARTGELAFLDGENVCYTMHTLVVAREKGTDSTRLVRQQTCTPSDRFRINHSVNPPRVVK